MTLSGALTLLRRLADGPRERRELFGFWAKEETIDQAESMGWIVVGNVVALTDRGRRALDGERRREAFLADRNP